MHEPEGFNYLPAEWRAYIIALKGKGASQGPDFNAEVNLHADTVAERHDEQKG